MADVDSGFASIITAIRKSPAATTFANQPLRVEFVEVPQDSAQPIAFHSVIESKYRDTDEQHR